MREHAAIFFSIVVRAERFSGMFVESTGFNNEETTKKYEVVSLDTSLLMAEGKLVSLRNLSVQAAKARAEVSLLNAKNFSRR